MVQDKDKKGWEEGPGSIDDIVHMFNNGGYFVCTVIDKLSPNLFKIIPSILPPNENTPKPTTSADPHVDTKYAPPSRFKYFLPNILVYRHSLGLSLRK